MKINFQQKNLLKIYISLEVKAKIIWDVKSSTHGGFEASFHKKIEDLKSTNWVSFFMF